MHIDNPNSGLWNNKDNKSEQLITKDEHCQSIFKLVNSSVEEKRDLKRNRQWKSTYVLR
jgi:hypothetical protein